MNPDPTPKPNPEPLQLDPDTRARLERHLDAVEDVLRRYEQPRATRSAILDELENQILDKLTQQTTGDTATLDDLHTVLADMDPPEAYARNSIDLPAPSPFAFPDEPPPKLNRATLLGLLWIAWFALAPLVAVLLVFTVVQPAYDPARDISLGLEPSLSTPAIYAYQTWWGTLILIFICIPGLLAPIATTLLGWIGLNQIKASHGREMGLGLALFNKLFFPVVLLNAVLTSIIVCIALFAGRTTPAHADAPPSGLGPIILLLGSLLLLAAQFFLTRRLIRSVRRSHGV